MQAELEAAKATGELLRTQIVTKVQAVAAHERRVERIEAQLDELTKAKASALHQLKVSPGCGWHMIRQLQGHLSASWPLMHHLLIFGRRAFSY